MQMAYALDARSQFDEPHSGSSHGRILAPLWETRSSASGSGAGTGLLIRHGWADTIFGPALGMATEHGLCAIGLARLLGREKTFAALAAQWPGARLVADDDAIAPAVRHALEPRLTGAGMTDSLALHVMGTDFQIRVWQALLNVPEGRLTTYGALARAIGAPGAARAVGRAVGANPLAPVIPCHRVVPVSGGLGGYRWGEDVKRGLLAREGA